MRYEDIDEPIEAGPLGEAFRVAYVAQRRGIRRWLCGWNDGPQWSEQKKDAVWVRPDVGYAIRDHFGHYFQDVGRIRLFDRPPINETERLKWIVGENYWEYKVSK